MPTSDYEARINAALGTVLRYFNFLELNLGLCIRFLENPADPEKSHAKLGKTSIQEKLDRLTNLLVKKKLITDREEFDVWYQEAKEARCVRNYYVHGTWEYLPLKTEKPLSFRLPPWRSENLRGEEKLTMSITELEQDAQDIREAFEKFMSLRQKYNV
ncbi:hypothetical protein [Thiococcus pfennigii]|uniref:hypothetical protein n=1 Tax=Thiococcus pfennigii TaxID=1057 RepID=UPI0019055695|nr:hypothetical protein [Thiococcus pfennigii]